MHTVELVVEPGRGVSKIRVRCPAENIEAQVRALGFCVGLLGEVDRLSKAARGIGRLSDDLFEEEFGEGLRQRPREEQGGVTAGGGDG